MPGVDKDFLIKWCKKVNENPANTIGDKILIDLFSDTSNSIENYFLRVCMVDYLWSAKLNMSRKRNIEEVARYIKRALPSIEDICQLTPASDLLKIEIDDTNSGVIIESIKKIRECCRVKEGISFPCKYLHLTKPMLFVPWDNLVPEAIKDVEDIDVNISNNDVLENYISLLKVYKEMAKRFTEQEKQDIINIEYESQECYKTVRKNTFIRIIDKALWGYKKIGNN